MLRVLATDAYVSAIGFLAILVEHENPLSACGLEEGAARDDDGLLGLAKFEVDVVGLARADVLRALATEDEITAELALANFWIDLANLQLVCLVATRKGGRQTLAHTVDIVLVYLSLYLIIREVVQLANLLSRTDALLPLHQIIDNVLNVRC